ncbi:neprilysin-like [Leptopilina heterotoma]|uniref:neprilysin-like n=1 Tax=Leptopilina heterotoma TaxID=63436 RepID=UPI001CA9EB8E|nr:neprilysin-like [Leptopilina heterotoma]
MERAKLYFLLYKLLCLYEFVNGHSGLPMLPRFENLVKESIDKRVEPCNDFQSYVCGNRTRDYNLLKLDNKKFAQHTVFKVIQGILQEPLNSLDASTINLLLNKEKKWYNACLNESSAEQSFQILKLMVNETGGVLPINIEPVMRWQNVASMYAKIFGTCPLFNVVYEENVVLLRIGKPLQWSIFQMSRYYISNAIEEFFLYFSSEELSNSNETILKKTKKSLRNLIDEILEYTNQESIGHKFYTIEGFSNFYNEILNENYKIDWLKLFQEMDMDLRNDDKLKFDWNYFIGLRHILQRRSSIEIANYIHFMYTMNSLTFIYWYRGDLLSVDERRSAACIQNMPIKEGINAEVITVHLQNTIEYLQQMFDNIVIEFRREIKSLKNVDLKEILLNQLSKLQIGTTDTENGFKWLASETVSYKFDVGLCGLENVMNFGKAQSKFKVNHYRTRLMHFLSYKPRRNKRQIEPIVKFDKNNRFIRIPIWQLYSALFNIDAPVAWNYAYFGSAIALKISQALEQMYPLIYRGKNFLSDNNMGLKLAYKVFKNEIKKKTKKYNNIIGMNDFNQKQQFFITYAAIYCDSLIYKERNNDKHSGGLNTVMMNLKSFRKAFNCRIGSPMNP